MLAGIPAPKGDGSTVADTSSLHDRMHALHRWVQTVIIRAPFYAQCIQTRLHSLSLDQSDNSHISVKAESLLPFMSPASSIFKSPGFPLGIQNPKDICDGFGDACNCTYNLLNVCLITGRQFLYKNTRLNWKTGCLHLAGKNDFHFFHFISFIWNSRKSFIQLSHLPTPSGEGFDA